MQQLYALRGKSGVEIAQAGEEAIVRDDVAPTVRAYLGETLRLHRVDSPSDRLLRNPTTGIAACCAHAANGHATAAPPTSVMNSRRRICTPKLRASIVSAQTSTLIGDETGIKTIAAVHSQCR
jgi:hypothetical protein